MNGRWKVLVTDSVHANLINGLENDGFNVHYDKNISREKVRQILLDYHGIVINSRMIMDQGMIDAAPNLKFIARLGSGMEIVDIPYAQSKNIALHRCPEGNADAVAEHAIGMILSLLNNLPLADQEVRRFEWNREKHRGVEIGGKVVGVIGFGETGSRFARKLSGFDVKVLAFDKYKKHFASDIRYVEEVHLEKVIESSDIISLHIPLTPETKGMVDKTFIERCKKGVILINTSRGKVVNTADLLDGLERGQVRATGMDVFENEKPATMSDEEHTMYERLFAQPNTIFSPHVAGWTIESKIKLADILLDKIRAMPWD